VAGEQRQSRILYSNPCLDEASGSAPVSDEYSVHSICAVLLLKRSQPFHQRFEMNVHHFNRLLAFFGQSARLKSTAENTKIAEKKIYNSAIFAFSAVKNIMDLWELFASH
jgi:hypothetical protein